MQNLSSTGLGAVHRREENPSGKIYFVGCTGISRYREGTESRDHAYYKIQKSWGTNALCQSAGVFLNLGGTADKKIRPKLQLAV